MLNLVDHFQIIHRDQGTGHADIRFGHLKKAGLGLLIIAGQIVFSGLIVDLLHLIVFNLQFASNFIDAALDQGESSLDSFVTTKIEPALVNALDVYKKQDRKENISLNIDTSGATPTAVVSPSLLEKSLVLIYDALATDMDNVSFDVVVQENTYDGAVELQILGPGNSEVADLIKIYRENQNNIINVISRDKQDVMLNLAKASSIIRRMNGAMSVETFGGEEGNLVMLTLPMVKRT